MLSIDLVFSISEGLAYCPSEHNIVDNLDRFGFSLTLVKGEHLICNLKNEEEKNSFT